MNVKRLLVLLSVFSGLALALWSPEASASCANALPTQAQLRLTVNLEEKGEYRLWIRQITPAVSNQLFVSVDDNCALGIVKNQQSDKLSWSGADNDAKPLLFVLDKGQHQIVLAGENTGSGVDMGLLTTDHECIPQEKGDNCLVAPAGELVKPKDLVKPPVAEEVDDKFGIILVIIAIVVLAGTIGLLLNHYLRFSKKTLPVTVGEAKQWLRFVLSPSTVRRFAKHHKPLLMLYAAVLLIFTLLLFIGISTAVQNKALIFEAEAGETIGSAAKLPDEQASGGTYVLFGGSAPAIMGSEQTPKNPTPVTPLGGNNNGGGGSGGGGGGGGNPAPTLPGECPKFPAFPDENCTGWEHTGVTLKNCDSLLDGNGTGNFWIWDDNPVKTYDSCYFSGNVVVQAAGITITRSQVHGSVSFHWSSNYSLRGLKLVDVEIEQEGVADPVVAIAGNDWECTRCDAHHGVSGMHFGDNTHIRDSYVHDMQWLDGSHGSGIATGQDHGSNSTIIHNNIQCNRVNGPPICSSALSIYPEDDNGDGQTVKNVQVEKNLFNATGAYCVYAVSIPGSNINFVDNVFGKKFYAGCAGYGPVTGYGPDGGSWINNVWADGSGPVDPS